MNIDDSRFPTDGAVGAPWVPKKSVSNRNWQPSDRWQPTQSSLSWMRISIDCDPSRVTALRLGLKGRDGRPWSCRQISEREIDQATVSMKLPFFQ